MFALVDTRLLLLGGESRDVSGLMNTMLDHTRVLLECAFVFRLTPALVHVPRDGGLRYRIHMLMQTRAAPMPYMCKSSYSMLGSRAGCLGACAQAPQQAPAEIRDPPRSPAVSDLVKAGAWVLVSF